MPTETWCPLKEVKFKDVADKDHFVFKDLIWQKLCADTAIPAGYSCSNSIKPDEKVIVMKNLNEGLEYMAGKE